MFADYIRTVRNDTLLELLGVVQPLAKGLIASELDARRRGVALFLQPIHIWMKTAKGWEHQQVDLKQASRMALAAQIKCHRCVKPIHNIHDYIRNTGWCYRCNQHRVNC